MVNDGLELRDFGERRLVHEVLGRRYGQVAGFGDDAASLMALTEDTTGTLVVTTDPCPPYASWLNRIEPQFKGVRYFCLDGTDHPDHDTQTRLILDYIDWRNIHRDDPKLRHLTRRPLTRKAA